MNEAKLNRELNSVGRATFVQHFDLLSECPPEGHPKDCLAELVRLRRSNSAGAGRRCYAARRIFRANKEMDALRMVSNSPGVPLEVREAALFKLRQLS